MTGMNVMMDPVLVHLMLHVVTQMAHTAVPAILVTLEMEEIVTGMIVMMDLVLVHLMPHAPTQLTQSSVPAVLATLEME